MHRRDFAERTEISHAALQVSIDRPNRERLKESSGHQSASSPNILNFDLSGRFRSEFELRGGAKSMIACEAPSAIIVAAVESRNSVVSEGEIALILRALHLATAVSSSAVGRQNTAAIASSSGRQRALSTTRWPGHRWNGPGNDLLGRSALSGGKLTSRLRGMAAPSMTGTSTPPRDVEGQLA